MQTGQHSPSSRMGLGQSGRSHLISSHCAMVVCIVERRGRVPGAAMEKSGNSTVNENSSANAHPMECKIRAIFAHGQRVVGTVAII